MEFYKFMESVGVCAVAMALLLRIPSKDRAARPVDLVNPKSRIQ